MRRNAFLDLLCALSLTLLWSCSTTRNLPEGEVLYVGQKAMEVLNRDDSPTALTALEEVEAAIATAPNNSFMGSSSIRTPFPVGLWIYNEFKNSEGGLDKWIFDHFSSDPVLLSGVNAPVRSQAAKNILNEYGYFRSKVGFETIYDKKDSLKAYLKYKIDMGVPYFVDTVYYKGFSRPIMDIVERAHVRSLLRDNAQFNVVELDAERTRLSELLRNTGRYYFRSDYMTYQADTLQGGAGHVSLRLTPIEGMPEIAEKPYVVGNTIVTFLDSQNDVPTDSIVSHGMLIRYSGEQPVRSRLLRRWINYQNYRFKRRIPDSTGIDLSKLDPNRYSQHRQTRIEERLTSLGLFKYKEINYFPRGGDPLLSDTLDAYVTLMMDKKYNAELDFNVKMKTNNQAGPGAAFSITRYNIFRGGENFTVSLKGNYEWQTGRNSTSDMNSYEIGVNSQLTFPRVMLPKLHHVEFDFPATSAVNLYVRQLSMPKYYRLLAFGGSAQYDFQPSRVIKHTIIPFRLTYNMLSHETDAFKELQEQTPALYMSLRSQLIPAMEYTFTYDNTTKRGVTNPLWWQTTITSAGNLTSLAGWVFGKDMSKAGKHFLGVPYAQYLKINSELRYHQVVNEDVMVAYRAAAGAVWSYGNSLTAPYADQFYIGGPNSIRAYSARNVGPGGFPPDKDNKYSFINHVGDLRLEANAEVRFRIVNDLHGAVFLDAGNVWLFRQDETRPDAKFRLKNLFKQTALGTGFGLRYDMDYLVFRLDMGYALHHPYDTGKNGYFNMYKLKDNVAIHFAIGYPF